MPTPLHDLGEILASLDATLRPEPYAVVEAGGSEAALRLAHAVVAEDEGPTAVLPAADAEALGLAAGPAFAWLTLTVHSSLESVGLTAAFSRALADAGIGCNVLAGFHHDHLLVPWAERDRAIAVVRGLRAG